MQPSETDIQQRTKAFALILRFGHDLMSAPSFDAAAVMAVNNSQSILGF